MDNKYLEDKIKVMVETATKEDYDNLYQDIYNSEFLRIAIINDKEEILTSTIKDVVGKEYLAIFTDIEEAIKFNKGEDFSEDEKIAKLTFIEIANISKFIDLPIVINPLGVNFVLKKKQLQYMFDMINDREYKKFLSKNPKTIDVLNVLMEMDYWYLPTKKDDESSIIIKTYQSENVLHITTNIENNHNMFIKEDLGSVFLKPTKALDIVCDIIVGANIDKVLFDDNITLNAKVLLELKKDLPNILNGVLDNISNNDDTEMNFKYYMKNYFNFPKVYIVINNEDGNDKDVVMKDIEGRKAQFIFTDKNKADKFIEEKLKGIPNLIAKDVKIDDIDESVANCDIVSINEQMITNTDTYMHIKCTFRGFLS